MKDIQTSTQIANQLPGSLPEGIILKEFQIEPGRDNRPDARAVLGTAQKEFSVVIEIQNTGGTASLREAARQVKSYAYAAGAIPFVAGTFFGERSREVAKEEEVGLMDLAGNFYLNREDLYIEKIVEKNPFSQKKPLKNLFAPVSSRITRSLLLNPNKEWLLNELAQESNVSLGQTYKVVERMIQEEMLGKNEKSKLTLKNPAILLEEWEKVYPNYPKQKLVFFSFAQNYIAILNAVLKVGEKEKLKYALGFFTGADLIAPFIRGISKVQLYIPSVQDLEIWKRELDLKETDSGGNIEFYVPYDEGVFYKTQQIKSNLVGEIPIVSNIQLYLDLFNNPARGEEAAKHLREIKLKY